jgi:acetylornithine aminotransferase
VGELLRKELEKIFGDAAEVRGLGLMIGVEFQSPIARAFCQAALDRGVLANDPTDKIVRLTPPLVISDQELERALSVFEEVWDEVRAS